MKNFLANLLSRLKRLTVGQIIFLVVAAGLAIGVFYIARGVTMCMQMVQLPGVPPESCYVKPATPTLAPGETPAANNPDDGAGATPTAPAAAPVILPEPWDGASRVTLLVIGLDYTDVRAAAGPPRSDTLILLTIDPATRTAGMLSIPRDMWVNVPGYGYYKINSAYALGEGSRLPGGGPELARQTVEQFLGVPVQYYAQIDFQALTRMIDEIGGVKIDITEPITIDLIGSEDPVTLQPGRYTLPGDYVLAYARARNTPGGDVDRARRQQQVILAVRDRLLEPGNFPMLVSRAPALYNELQSGIRTNLPLNDALRLAMLARDIPLDNIQRGVIDTTMFVYATSPQGLDINKPIMDKIRELRDTIFITGGAIGPRAGNDLAANAAAEAARIQVINGAYVPGLAQNTGNYLISLGLNVVAVGSSDTYVRTVVVLHSGKPYTLRFLQQVFPLSSSSQIVMRPDPASPTDIDIYLGQDWAAVKPFP